MLLTFCTNVQVFQHFPLQSSPMKLYFWYLSCKHFPEITHQYLLFAPLFTWNILKHLRFQLCCERYRLTTLGVGRIFSRGGAVRDFSKFFPGGDKVVKFGFHPSKLKKQPFLLIISESRGETPLPPPFRSPCILLDIGLNLWHSLVLQSQISNFPYSLKKICLLCETISIFDTFTKRGTESASFSFSATHSTFCCSTKIK